MTILERNKEMCTKCHSIHIIGTVPLLRMKPKEFD